MATWVVTSMTGDGIDTSSEIEGDTIEERVDMIVLWKGGERVGMFATNRLSSIVRIDHGPEFDVDDESTWSAECHQTYKLGRSDGSSARRSRR